MKNGWSLHIKDGQRPGRPGTNPMAAGRPAPSGVWRWMGSVRAAQRGSSLLEMIITLAILAILTSAALPLARTAARSRQETELRRALREIRFAIDRYKEFNDQTGATHSGRVAYAKWLPQKPGSALRGVRPGRQRGWQENLFCGGFRLIR